MKFSTGSSSSSLASDSLSRKSTLCIYTEADAPALHCERMDTGSETMELRRELETMRSALQKQSESVLRQRHQLVEAGHALSARDQRAARERRLRQDQLALVLRSLVLLESRLTREQRQINVALQQRERLIKSQQEEITKLKTRKSYCSNCQQILGFTSEQTNIETDPEFHSLESTDSRIQNNFTRSCSYNERNVTSLFQKNTRLSKSFQITKNDVVYGTSSSEEGNNGTAKGTFLKNKQAFVRRDVLRRSRKCSGRKHNSKYLENIQKNYNSQPNSSSAEDCTGVSYETNCNNDTMTYHITKDIRKASLKIDQLIEESVKNDLNGANYDSDKPFSSKIERLHGIKRKPSNEININRAMFLNNVLNDEGNEKPWYVNISDPEQEMICSEKRCNKLTNVKSRSTDNLLKTSYNEGTLNAEVISARNEILCNSIMSNFNRDGKNNPKSYSSKHDSPVEHNENWYASTSDADDSHSNEIYKNNPVLECVNQILLQNSLDDSSNDNSKSSEAPSPKSTTKKVQFSTLNSISCDDKTRNISSQSRPDKRANKIVKFSLETASEHSYEIPNTCQGFNYEIQSVISNEYEPILSKDFESPRPVPFPRTVGNVCSRQDIPNIRGSIVKNIAANIENRNSNNNLDNKSNINITKVVNKKKVPRTPPALPPKPKNLTSKIKTENNIPSKASIPPLDSEAVAATQRIADVKMRKSGQVAIISSTVEPDYCSISEINVPVVSNGKRELLLTQPTIEIHSEQCPILPVSQRNSVAKVVSLPRIQTTNNNIDIPKLPQVTEIIIPDEDDSKPNNSLNDGAFQQSLHKTSYHPSFNISLQPKLESRASIQMGNSVSSILSEINKGGKSGNKEINLTDLDNQFNNNSQEKVQNNSCMDKIKAEYFDDIDKFDLSQNFEEFRIEDDLGSIVAEEYRISSSSSDSCGSDVVADHINSNVPEKNCQNNVVDNKDEKTVDNNIEKNLDNTFLCNDDENALNNELTNTNTKMFNKPDLLSNIENLETDSVRNSDIESSNSSGSNSGSYNTVKCEPGMIINNIESCSIARANKISFDFFLETSGLSSKSIVTPTKNYLGLRPPNANHKNVLKPRDVKMRVKTPVTTNKVNEKAMTTAIKYFEPYL